jgi:hypothetical protein
MNANPKDGMERKSRMKEIFMPYENTASPVEHFVTEEVFRTVFC